MPTLIESARFASISALNKSFVGKKLRLAGRLLGYDATYGRILLLDADGKYAVVVDVRDTLDESSSHWVNERRGSLMVMGYIEESLEELPSLDTVPFARGAPRPHPSLLLKAILVVPAGDMDLKVWGAVVGAEKSIATTT